MEREKIKQTVKFFYSLNYKLNYKCKDKIQRYEFIFQIIIINNKNIIKLKERSKIRFLNEKWKYYK
jgi:hypothetical protein